MRGFQFDRVVFLLSALFLAALYGYLARTFAFFPHQWLVRSVTVAGQILVPERPGERPHFAGELVHDLVGARIVDDPAIAPGLTLISTHDEDHGGHPTVKLVNREGRVLHRWTVAPAEVFAGAPFVRSIQRDMSSVHGSHLFSNGDLLVNLDYMGTVRLDACSEVVWRSRNGAHHAIAPAYDGTYWIPVSGPAEVPSSTRYPDGFPGLDEPVHHDRLLRITDRGEVLDSISVLDVLFDNGLQRFLAKARAVEEGDVLHVNDVEVLSRAMASSYPTLEAGDLMVSIRASDLVLIIEPESGGLRWYTSDRLVQQHDPDFIGGGWVGVFNNNSDGSARGELIGGTEVVAFQPHTDSVSVLVRPYRYPFQAARLHVLQEC